MSYGTSVVSSLQRGAIYTTVVKEHAQKNDKTHAFESQYQTNIKCAKGQRRYPHGKVIPPWEGAHCWVVRGPTGNSLGVGGGSLLRTLVKHLLWVRHWPDIQEHRLNNVSKVRQIVRIKSSTEKLAFQFFMTRDRKRMFDRNELQNK